MNETVINWRWYAGLSLCFLLLFSTVGFSAEKENFFLINNEQVFCGVLYKKLVWGPPVFGETKQVDRIPVVLDKFDLNNLDLGCIGEADKK